MCLLSSADSKNLVIESKAVNYFMHIRIYTYANKLSNIVSAILWTVKCAEICAEINDEMLTILL